MSTLSELARARTALAAVDVAWLHRLVADWQLVADLSFADLLLWAPLRGMGGWVALAQMRPTTGPTAHHDDLVGALLRPAERPLVDTAWREQRICREADPEWRAEGPIREETIPVRRDDRVIAVVARHTNLSSARSPSRLEMAYLETASDLAQMIAEGSFPFIGPSSDPQLGPRVGDGLLRLDAEGAVVYASPNAQSAYRRLGVAGNVVGARLRELTAQVVTAGGGPADPSIGLIGIDGPRESEVEAAGAVVAVREIPLLPGGERVGALVLVRDVSEVRHRDRQLVSKDATIREIHHRVKNNLQTVAALLRLQARRLTAAEARAALEESVRRVSSIALVHETLSLTLDEQVAFDEIADRVLAMVAELVGPTGGVTMRRVGSFGVLPAQVATPLSMVLTELLQNAVEHAFPGRPGRLEVRAEQVAGGRRLSVVVADDGAGLPPGFVLADSPRLGLQIVRTLVGELAGELALRAKPGGGTEAVLDVPLPGGGDAGA